MRAEKIVPDEAGEAPSDAPKDPLRVSVLARALGVLECVLQSESQVPLSRIVEVTGLDTATAHRFLKIFTSLGYIARDPVTRGYLPGPKGASPLPAYHPLNAFRRDAQEIMQQLRNDTGLTVALFAFVAHARILLDLAPGISGLSPYWDSHTQRPLHASASGKLLLSTLPPDERSGLLGPEPYAKLTARTIAARGALDKDIARGAERGYFVARDEAVVGLTAVSAPLFGENRKTLACLVLIGSTSRLAGDSLEQAIARLTAAANLISHATPSLRKLYRP